MRVRCARPRPCGACICGLGTRSVLLLSAGRLCLGVGEYCKNPYVHAQVLPIQQNAGNAPGRVQCRAICAGARANGGRSTVSAHRTRTSSQSARSASGAACVCAVSALAQACATCGGCCAGRKPLRWCRRCSMASCGQVRDLLSFGEGCAVVSMSERVGWLCRGGAVFAPQGAGGNARGLNCAVVEQYQVAIQLLISCSTNVADKHN